MMIKLMKALPLIVCALMAFFSVHAAAGEIDTCPNPIIIQTDWFPTPERAVAYELAGPDGKINADKGSYTGILKGTDIAVEVRVGGPYIGYSSPTALLYQDPSILLGFIQTDQAVENFMRQPTVSIFAALDINPQVLMFDPEQFAFESIADIGKTDVPVLTFEGLPFVDFLIAKGMLKKSQVDSSFNGSPARFIASGGKVVVIGYASNEPYRYEHDIENWMKPVKTLLINDAGYEIYPENIGARAADIEKYSDCFKALVPRMQQAAVDYTKSPTATNTVLMNLAEALKVPVPLTEKGNAFAVKTMLELGLMSNGHNKTVGDFDMTRVQRVIDEQLAPAFEARGSKIKPGLKAEQVHTNQFIDHSKP